MNSVKVIFKNSNFNYITTVSDQIDKQKAKSYFVGSFFDVGMFPNENLQKCNKIAFRTDKKSVYASKVLQLMDQDFEYQKALKTVLNENKSINAIDLKFELELYI